MNRRGFLRALGLGAAGFALDPERLLWVPGQRSYVFLVEPVSLAQYRNTFITPDWLIADTLRVLENRMEWTNRVIASLSTTGVR